MIDIIKRLIRYVKVTAAGTNGSKLWTQQVTYLGKTADCLMVFPYGMHANLPQEKVLALMFSVQGHMEMRAGIGWTPQLRPDLEPGEVAYYHPFTESVIIMRNNGDIDIDTVKEGGSNNLNVNTQNWNITVAETTTLTCPQTDIIGNVAINGTLDVTGNIHSDAEVSNSSISLGGHVHSQGTDSAGDTQVDTGVGQ